MSGINKREILEKLKKHEITADVALKLYTSQVEDDKLDSVNNEEIIKEQIIDYLKNMISKETNIKIERISEYDDIGSFGLDSLMILNFNDKLDLDFEGISKTLFYEYKTIDEIADYILENYSEEVKEKFKIKNEIKEEHVELQSEEFNKQNDDDFYVTDIKYDKQDSKIDLINDNREDEIAIIGISGKYPQADNLYEFWNNIKLGKDCISEIPKDRWDFTKRFTRDKDEKGKVYSKWGGFINDVDKFDSLFFNISPKEAKIMDPQERIFMENSWNTIEDAGYTRDSLKKHTVGVFVGVMYGQYQMLAAEETKKDNVMAASSFYSAIANRVSYFFDFKGPSIALDTMCSSSITSIHLACESIRNGECDMALAGGVNLTLHENKYIYLCQEKFAASDGRCRSFGKDGDGYVPGEGVGSVLLKSLRKAEEDGDHIYAVIKGSAINHGGKSNGYSVPDPNAQANVISNAFKKSGIPLDRVGYLEMHGTGTALGDPIEIAGISKVFNNNTKADYKCPIGSVKSNIGHLESAAGIAAITKVILQMKYGMIVPSIHSDELNPNINFEKSHFYVERNLKKWNRYKEEKEGRMIEYPRVAGISAFGAGGSNAHIILEEYVDKRKDYDADLSIYVIPLSADTDEQLVKEAENLVNFIDLNDVNIQSIAYTLQIGRTSLNKRIAVIAKNISDLKEKLINYINNVKERYVLKNNEDLESIQDENMSITMAKKWLSKKDVDWMELYNGTNIKKIPLPGYPFKKIRHWINIKDDNYQEGKTFKSHEFVHKNVSNLKEQRYVSKFTGREDYFRDHKVNDKEMLPAAVQLEMMRFAAEDAGSHKVNSISDVILYSPIYDNKQEISISVMGNAEGLKCKIWSSEHNEEIVYSKCTVEHNEKEYLLQENINLKNLIDRYDLSMHSEEFYKHMIKNKMNYGSSFRMIKNVKWNDQEAVAEIDADYLSLLKDVKLNPGVIDGALQATGIFTFFDKNNISYVPYSIGKVIFKEPFSNKCNAYVKKLSKNSYDIYLADNNGNVFCKIENLSVVPVIKPLYPQDTKNNIKLLSEKWVEEKNAFEDINNNNIFIAFTYDEENMNYIRKLKNDLNCEFITVTNSKNLMSTKYEKYIDYDSYDDIKGLFEELSHEYEKRIFNIIFIGTSKEAEITLKNSIYFIFNLTKGIISTRSKNKYNLICMCKKLDSKKYCLYSSTEAFMKVLNNESSSMKAKFIEVDNDFIDSNTLLKEFNIFTQSQVKFINGNRYISTLTEIYDKSSSKIEIRYNGTYIITGGTGKLGLIISKYISNKNRCNIILLGRSDLKKEVSDQMQDIRNEGINIEYVKCDITDINDVENKLEVIRSKYHEINGVIHTAGIIKDSFILNKDLNTFEKVIAPKVRGTLILDEVLKNDKLDFFIMFSSIATVIGNIGQCDYCYGNEFMNDFAEERNKLIDRNERSGITLSINWPLWANGGMEVSETKINQIRKSTGLDWISENQGMKAFEKLLLTGKGKSVVFNGDYDNFKNKFILHSKEIVHETNHSSLESDKKLIKKLEIYVKKVIADEVEMGIDEIISDESLSRLGLTSIMMMNIIKNMSKKIENISSTLFYENDTVTEIVNYLLENNYDDVITGFKELKQSDHTKAIKAADMSEKQVITETVSKPSEIKSDDYNDDIAIIGVSGRYPQADNLEEFWQNLLNKKDCITEVPKERWNWQDYYDSEKGKKGYSYGRWGGFLNNIDKFDPLEFNISPKEAKLMDPQERLFLETVLECMEDAGYSKTDFNKHRVGVFVGAMYSQYQLYSSKEGGYASSNLASIANRVSYVMNFHGPSMALDTMCSSSLTAIHLACQSIKEGECDTAVVGGVNLSVHPNKYLLLSQGLFLSSEGKCRSFGEGGDGYVPGEGVGAVIIKSLKDAIRDKDNIYAVIKATGINHGGKTSGFTVPSGKAQSEIIKDVIKKAEVNPRDITYMEAHGTGTALGDPIELQSLKNAFKDYTSDKQFCSIGSVKSNIGHLESAAGIASLTKVILQLKYKTIVPTLHCEKPNNKIDFKNSPFSLSTTVEKWDNITREGKLIPRTAAISAFGAGGSNAHIILQEWNNEEEIVTNYDKADATIITLSGRKKEQIVIQAKQLLKYLSETNKINTKKQINLKEIFRNMLSKILKLDLDDSCYNQEFSELGMDTRDLVNLKNMIEESFKVELNIEDISKNSTINKLSEYIESIHLIESEEVEVEKGLLYDMAYTLWNGRDKRKSRLAIVTNSITDLKDKLQRYVNGDENIEEVYFSDTDNNVLINCFDNEADLDTIINRWTENEEFNKIAQFWVSGMEVNWDTVFKNVTARKISLPSYPLLRQSYWLEHVEKHDYIVQDEKIHLLGNMDFKESCKSEWIVFSKVIEKDNRLLKDHNVNNDYILPGAASLEIILEGINYLIEDKCNNKFNIKDLKWNKPIRCINDKCEIKSYLKMVNNEIIFNIRQNIDGSEVINVSGKFVRSDNVSEIKKINLNHYKNTLEDLITRDEVYDILTNLKLNYGEYLRGIEYIHASSKEELSFIKMPEKYANDFDKYILPPSILDSAFQSIVGMQGEHDLSVPAKIDEINIINKVQRQSYVYCVNVNQNKYNMYICDGEGNVCIELINLTLAAIGNKQIKKSNTEPKNKELDFIYTTNWTEERNNQEQVKSTVLKNRNNILIFFTRDSESIAYSLKNLYGSKNIKLIELCDRNEEINESYRKLNVFDEQSIRECIKSEKEIDSIYLAATNVKDKIYDIDLDLINKAQEESILLLFRIIKQLENEGYNGKEIDINIITNNVCPIKDEEVNPYYSYLCGFGKSLSKEKNNWNVQEIDIDLFNDTDINQTVSAIYNMPDNLLNKSVAIRESRYYTVELNKISLKENIEGKSFVNKGTYVIVGGTGGIGSELSYYMAKNYKANVVLIGRKKINSKINEQLEKIKSLGGRGLYIEADMCDANSMKEALNIIKGEFSVINGVIHSALVLNDRMINLMSENELRKVLNPKVNGSVVLAQTFKDEKLDFIMFFSSAQAFAGSIGQSNYSAACSFKDAFAWYLKSIKNMNVRIINWGYWSEVGVVSSDDYINSLREQGIYPISINEGMDIIDKALRNKMTQIMPIKVSDEVLKSLGKISSNESEKDNELQKIYDLKKVNDDLEEIIPYMIAVQLQKIGLFKEEHEFIEINNLKNKINLIDKYNNLFDEILNILEQAALIIKDHQIVITTSKVTENLELKVNEFKSVYINKGLEKELALLEICMNDLINILDGNKNATQVIFSGASVKYVEGIYTGNVLVDYFNNKVRKFIEEYLKNNVNKAKKLRILEVGAGTGGTTKALLSLLEKYSENIEYHYTDISNRFIEYGKSNFGSKYDFFKFNILNIEDDLSVYNFDKHSFDMVIATNVLHATKDIDKTICNIEELLKNNGQVVINEVTNKRSFLTMTFGLLDGWWLSQDSKRIEGSPLLSKDDWKDLLVENNFEVINDIDAVEDHIGYQRVITGINKNQNDEVDMIEAELVHAEEMDFDTTKESNSISIIESKLDKVEEIKSDNKPVNVQKFIEDKIIESIIESLEISKSEIDKNRAFSEYGIDSITGLDLVKKINDKFNIALKTTVIFDYPYISKLAEFINDKFKVI